MAKKKTNKKVEVSLLGDGTWELKDGKNTTVFSAWSELLAALAQALS